MSQEISVASGTTRATRCPVASAPQHPQHPAHEVRRPRTSIFLGAAAIGKCRVRPVGGELKLPQCYSSNQSTHVRGTHLANNIAAITRISVVLIVRLFGPTSDHTRRRGAVPPQESAHRCSVTYPHHAPPLNYAGRALFRLPTKKFSCAITFSQARVLRRRYSRIAVK